MDAQKLDQLLRELNYPASKREYLVNGFTKGFSLEFEGNWSVQRKAPNLKIRIGSKAEIWEKVTDEQFYFVDKCLPFRSSISCFIFQLISDSIVHLVSFRTKKGNINYLDDFFLCHSISQYLWLGVEYFLEGMWRNQIPSVHRQNFLECDQIDQCFWDCC